MFVFLCVFSQRWRAVDAVVVPGSSTLVTGAITGMTVPLVVLVLSCHTDKHRTQMKHRKQVDGSD